MTCSTPLLDAMAEPPARYEASEHRQNEQDGEPQLDLDDPTDERHETDTDPEHDRSHLDGDVLLCPHGTGEPGLEQIGVDAVDVLGGVEP